MSRTTDLMDQIKDAHEFEDGQAYSWEACGVHGTDKCPICGLEWHWARGGQNSPDSDSFERNGSPVCMADAVECR